MMLCAQNSHEEVCSLVEARSPAAVGETKRCRIYINNRYQQNATIFYKKKSILRLKKIEVEIDGTLENMTKEWQDSSGKIKALKTSVESGDERPPTGCSTY